METPWGGAMKVCSNGPGYMTTVASTRIFVKPPYKSSSPEPEGLSPWDLVCSIGDVGSTKFVQIMV